MFQSTTSIIMFYYCCIAGYFLYQFHFLLLYYHNAEPLFFLQILQILVRAVVENLTDIRGEQAQTLESKLKELLGRVTARHSSDGEIWQQYAKLYGDGHSTNPEDNEKVSVTAKTAKDIWLLVCAKLR